MACACPASRLKLKSSALSPLPLVLMMARSGGAWGGCTLTPWMHACYARASGIWAFCTHLNGPAPCPSHQRAVGSPMRLSAGGSARRRTPDSQNSWRMSQQCCSTSTRASRTRAPPAAGTGAWRACWTSSRARRAPPQLACKRSPAFPCVSRHVRAGQAGCCRGGTAALEQKP